MANPYVSDVSGFQNAGAASQTGPRQVIGTPEWVQEHLRSICLSVLEVDYSANRRKCVRGNIACAKYQFDPLRHVTSEIHVVLINGTSAIHTLKLDGLCTNIRPRNIDPCFILRRRLFKQSVQS
jgi:hypothetical protein